MKIKRIKSMRINNARFKIVWDDKHSYGSFSYPDAEIVIGTASSQEAAIFEVLCHELWEIAAIEMHCRFRRPDVGDDYIFVYDHRQHHTMTAMFSSMLDQFLELG